MYQFSSGGHILILQPFFLLKDKISPSHERVSRSHLFQIISRPDGTVPGSQHDSPRKLQFLRFRNLFHNALLQIKIMDHQLRRFFRDKGIFHTAAAADILFRHIHPCRHGCEQIMEIVAGRPGRQLYRKYITVSCHQIRMQQTILQTKQSSHLCQAGLHPFTKPSAFFALPGRNRHISYRLARRRRCQQLPAKKNHAEAAPVHNSVHTIFHAVHSLFQDVILLRKPFLPFTKLRQSLFQLFFIIYKKNPPAARTISRLKYGREIQFSVFLFADRYS